LGQRRPARLHRVGGKLAAYYTGYRREGASILRAICRAESDDGITWQRAPRSPVLAAGPADRWDGGGTAAGSVLHLGEPPHRYVMFFSGRRGDGDWTAVGRATSVDGLVWERQAEPLLTREHFDDLRHVALPDVIRTSTGHWLMHCEGWRRSAGWTIVQARSDDGRTWAPSQQGAALTADNLPWGSAHIANPKCLELTPGHFLLGFNAAGPDLAFHLGLAESDDARYWTVLPAAPAICAQGRQYRLESLFFLRDAWETGTQRVYFFGADEKLEPGSYCLTATADLEAAWPGGAWQTHRSGLYLLRRDSLVARAGARSPSDALSRRVPLAGETQCTVRLRPRGGDGGLTLTLLDATQRFEIALRGSAAIELNGELLARAHEADVLAACLRIARPDQPRPGLHLLAWQDERRIVDRHFTLNFRPAELEIRIAVPPAAPDLIVEQVEVGWPVGGSGSDAPA
jgi:hypothetical protein